MKKMLRLSLVAILLSLMGGIGISFAQGGQEVPPLPIDPAVRLGKLPNGLTYIIRHNEIPKERANFYIAQRVGSMQEEDNQSGLAHFLEHMAFNGSRNYEGKELINYLESIGVKFGSELNAYTSFDETMYTIKDAPVRSNGTVDSCLLILRDWSDGIALQEEEIDNERGVIENEWRQRDNGNMRAMTQIFKEVFPGLRYGKRMPIGSMDVVRNFTYQELRDYYHKWYRPDLQALIIVGDIDVDYVEKKIKELYKDVPAPVNPAERTYEEIPNHEAPICAIATDPEVTITNLSVAYTSDAMPLALRGTIAAFANDYMTNVVERMFSERISEIVKKPNAPFIQANLSIGSYMGLTIREDAMDFTAIAHEGKYEEAMKALVAEIKRVRDYGFTAGEYDRARTELLSQYENMMNSKANRTNTQYAMEYGKYFTVGGYIPGIDTEYALMSQMAPSISVELINKAVQEQLKAGENLVITLIGPAKEGLVYPTKEELLKSYNTALEQTVEAYVDDFASTELMSNDAKPKSGDILSVEKDEKLGVTRWALSNGATIYLMPTTYKKNDIRLIGVSSGGFNAEKLNHIDARALAMGFASSGGVADFSDTDLSKVLVGKNVNVRTSVREYRESISATSSDKDVETMFQLLYLRMTANRKDADAFASLKQRNKAVVEASKANPLNVVLRDSLPELMYPGQPLRHMSLNPSELDQINYDAIFEAQGRRFADASDFTFFLVGSFDTEAVKPYILQYIAALPSTHSKEADHSKESARMNLNSKTNHFNIVADTPTAIVVDVFANDGAYSLEESLKMNILGEVLSQQFFKSIREEEGGTYGVSVQGSLEYRPEGEESLVIFFQTDPESSARLNDKIKSELQKVASGEIDITEYFNKTILNLEKAYAENLEENKYWQNMIVDKYVYGIDFHTDYLKVLKALTVKDIQMQLQKLLKESRYLELVAQTEKTAAEAHAEAGIK